jgi:hypothetical protein
MCSTVYTVFGYAVDPQHICRCAVWIRYLCLCSSGLNFQPENLTVGILVSIPPRGMLGYYFKVVALSRLDIDMKYSESKQKLCVSRILSI